MRTENPQRHWIEHSAKGSKVREPRPIIHEFFPLQQKVVERNLKKAFAALMTGDEELQQKLYNSMEQENGEVTSHATGSFRIVKEIYPDYADYFFAGVLGGYHALRETAGMRKGQLPKIERSMIEDTIVEVVGGEDVFNALSLKCSLSEDNSVKAHDNSPQADERAKAFFQREEGISQALASLLGTPSDRDEQLVFDLFKSGIYNVASIFDRYQGVHKIQSLFGK